MPRGQRNSQRPNQQLPRDIVVSGSAGGGDDNDGGAAGGSSAPRGQAAELQKTLAKLLLLAGVCVAFALDSQELAILRPEAAEASAPLARILRKSKLGKQLANRLVGGSDWVDLAVALSPWLMRLFVVVMERTEATIANVTRQAQNARVRRTAPTMGGQYGGQNGAGASSGAAAGVQVASSSGPGTSAGTSNKQQRPYSPADVARLADAATPAGGIAGYSSPDGFRFPDVDESAYYGAFGTETGANWNHDGPVPAPDF